MKAAPTDNRPGFPLMTLSDIVSFYHLQMPRWLFSHDRYKHLSLESKVAYTFLLNRFQLSRLNGWVNDFNEVFVIFTRESLAAEMQVSYRKAIECFKELVGAGLIWERRLGRGCANQIYLAVVKLDDADAKEHSSAPFAAQNSRPAGFAYQGSSAPSPRPAVSAHQEIPSPQVMTCKTGTSEAAAFAGQEMPIPQTNNKDIKSEKERDNYMSDNDVSLYPGSLTEKALHDRQTEDKALQQILDNCELHLFPPEVSGVFKNAVERLFYSSTFAVGRAVLPRDRIRAHLQRLDGSILWEALNKLRSNLDRDIKNSTAYVMSVVFNCIWEVESDLLVDPYLNSLQAGRRREAAV